MKSAAVPPPDDGGTGLSPVSPREAGFSAERLGDYIALLKADIAYGRMPGAVVLLARGGRLVLFEALGRLRAGDDAAMPRDAIFRVHSMTKPMVSVAALRLIEQGRMQASDPIARHLREFASMRRLDGQAVQRAATVQDLLRHTAGFSYEFQADELAPMYGHAGLADRGRSNAESTAALAKLPLAREPGTAWQYSRATDVLGRLVEAVCGESLGEHLQHELFAPLGLKDTGFRLAPSQAARLAEPHPRDADTGAPVAMFNPLEPARLESGGGGLLSTAADYARFLRLLLEGGRLGDVRLLGRKTIEWMTADHLGDMPRADLVLPVGYGFGLGVAVRTAAGMAPDPGSVGSYGWSGSGGTIFFVDPAEAMFGVLMLQAPQQCERAWTRFRQMIYAALE